MKRFGVIALILALAWLGGGACGRKEAPRPPEDVLPQPIPDLTAASSERGITVAWGRPRAYIDGVSLRDLAGFEVWRLTPDSGEKFARIAVIPVNDRERFQRPKRFAQIDNAVVSGKMYHYYVVSFTSDGYYSAPSNLVTITHDGKAKEGDGAATVH